jgi:hypothetical protein
LYSSSDKLRALPAEFGFNNTAGFEKLLRV